ncbi:hypothetical protein [Aestuariivirga sp.]|uniref:hypothetical protein n=1 Tax=Aestuariivirga sp. TaxID=2650926 RepID=UPI0039E2A4B0
MLQTVWQGFRLTAANWRILFRCLWPIVIPIILFAAFVLVIKYGFGLDAAAIKQPNWSAALRIGLLVVLIWVYFALANGAVLWHRFLVLKELPPRARIAPVRGVWRYAALLLLYYIIVGIFGTSWQYALVANLIVFLLARNWLLLFPHAGVGRSIKSYRQVQADYQRNAKLAIMVFLSGALVPYALLGVLDLYEPHARLQYLVSIAIGAVVLAVQLFCQFSALTILSVIYEAVAPGEEGVGKRSAMRT